MSKRKGRKAARSSEIKSVLRAPPEGESEPGAETRDAADPDSDTLPLDVLGETVDPDADRDARRDGPGAPESGIPESAPAPADDAPSAAESEPGSAAKSSGRPRARRLRAVTAREAVTADGEGVDARAGSDEPSPDGDTLVVERNSEGLETRSDAVDESDREGEGEGDRDGADEGEGDDDEPFEPIPLEIDGDDTEGFLRGLIEALLFTSQKPLDVKDLARSAGVDKPRAKELLEQLMASYEGRGLCVEQVAGGYVMRSSPRYAPYVQKILSLKPVRLSRAQLETLAIVAYRQPVTKPEVDDIRGVDSGQVIKGLLERSLLKMLGKKDEPGRPTLYGTTNDFLELLNLQSLKDLPTLREYTELSEESQRKFLEETGEAPPSGELSFDRPPASGPGGTDANGDAAAPDDVASSASATADESGEVSERQDRSGEEDSPEADRATSPRDEDDEDEPARSRPVASDESEDDEAPEDDAPRAGVEDDDEESAADENSDDDDEDDEDSDDDDEDEDDEDSDDEDEDED